MWTSNLWSKKRHGEWTLLGLPHCYKMLIELGPVSQDKAVTACGYEGGSTVVTFDNKGDDVS